MILTKIGSTILRELNNNEYDSIKLLSKNIKINYYTVINYIGDLEYYGIIIKETNKKDNNSKIIKLTPKGKIIAEHTTILIEEIKKLKEEKRR